MLITPIVPAISEACSSHGWSQRLITMADRCGWSQYWSQRLITVVDHNDWFQVVDDNGWSQWLVTIVDHNGWSQWLIITFDHSGWSCWLIITVDQNGWRQWLITTVDHNGWSQWLITTVYHNRWGALYHTQKLAMKKLAPLLTWWAIPWPRSTTKNTVKRKRYNGWRWVCSQLRSPSIRTTMVGERVIPLPLKTRLIMRILNFEDLGTSPNNRGLIKTYWCKCIGQLPHKWDRSWPMYCTSSTYRIDPNLPPW